MLTLKTKPSKRYGTIARPSPRLKTWSERGASAHRALTRILPDLGCALLEGEAPSLKRLFEIGSVAVSRSDEAWAALSEATVRLDSARLTLAALELQLGYIPGVSIAAGHPA